MANEYHAYITDDGEPVATGDWVYNYYDGCPGTIGVDRSTPREPGWFEFHRMGGGTDILNGQRICTLEYAVRRGFRHAAAGKLAASARR